MVGAGISDNGSREPKSSRIAEQMYEFSHARVSPLSQIFVFGARDSGKVR